MSRTPLAPSRSRIALGCLVVSLLVGAAAAPALGGSATEPLRSQDVCPPPSTEQDTRASSVGHPSRASYPDPPALSVARGDVLAIPTGIERGETGQVTLTGESLNVTVRYVNWDSDRTAVLYVNTYLAGNATAVDGLAYTGSGSDRVAVVDRSEAGGAPLATGSYNVSIDRPRFDENLTVNVTRPNVGGLDILRAPGDSLGSLGNESALHVGAREGAVTSLETADGLAAVAYGDTVVYRLNVSGLFGVLAAQRGATPEANFRSLEGDSPGEGRLFDLAISAQSPCPVTVAVDESVANGTLRVVPDATNETLYVLADLRRVETGGVANSHLRGPGTATYDFFRGSHVTDAVIERSVAYDVVARTVTFDPSDSAVRRQAASGQTLSGQTTLAPGTTLDIGVRALDGDYATRVETIVGADGTFAATVDLSKAPRDARFAVSAADTDSHPGLLVTGTATASAVWFDVEERPGPVANLTSVRAVLEDGGFVAAYAVPPDEQVGSAQLIGHSEYLEAGVSDATVRFDSPLTDSRQVVLVAHRDTDADGVFDYPAADDPYRQDGPIFTVGRVMLANDTQTPAPSSSEYLRVNLPPADALERTPTRTPTATPVTQTPTAAPTKPTTELPYPTTRGGTESSPMASGPQTATAAPPTPGPTPTPTAPRTTTAVDTTAADGPGVGAVGAVLALVLGALVERRRRE